VKDLPRAPAVPTIEREQPVGARMNPPHQNLVPHSQVENLPIPDQVIHPQRARHAIEQFPRSLAELRLVEGAERQRRQAHRGTRQLFRRAQRPHPSKVDPGAFLALWCTVEYEQVVDAEPLQHAGRHKAGHAGADDHDVSDGRAFHRAARHPGFCGQLQPGEILFQACLEGGEARRAWRGHGHEKALSGSSASLPSSRRAAAPSCSTAPRIIATAARSAALRAPTVGVSSRPAGEIAANRNGIDPTRLCVADVEHSAFFDCFCRNDRSHVCERSSLIEGMGRPRCEPSFVPDVVDRMMKVPDAASIAAMSVLSRLLRRPVGGSTGTNFLALCRLAAEMRRARETGSLVTLICDSGERYRQTYYAPDWLAAQGLDPAPYEAELTAFLETAHPLDIAIADTQNRSVPHGAA
jgi:hypothetical protein